MADTYRLERLSDGVVFEGPASDLPNVPDGYRLLKGSRQATVAPSELETTLRGWMDPIYKGLTGMGQSYRENIAEPLTNLVDEGLQAIPFSRDVASQGVIRGAAETVVPQTPIGVGVTLGSLASMGLPAAGRVAGSVAGGMVGGALEGSPATGAGVGAASGLVGEGLGYMAGAVRRHFGQQAADEKRIGAMFQERSPALRNPGTAAGLNEQVAQRTQPELSTALEQGLQDINAVLGGASMIASPAIQEAFPDAPARMTFIQAANYVKTLGAKGWSRSSGAASGGGGGSIARDLRAEAIEEIKAQLPQAQADAWARYTSAYGQGKILLDLLQEPNVLYPAKAGESFSGLGVPALQQKGAQYYTEGDLGRRFNTVEARSIESALQRGGTFSEGTDYPRGMFRRFYEGPGAQTFRIPLPTRYVGTPLMVPSAPFTAATGNFVDAQRLRNPYHR